MNPCNIGSSLSHPTLSLLPTCILFVKPPPKSLFDLEEIERREKEWDDEELKILSVEDIDDSDEEDDLFLEDTVKETTRFEFQVTNPLHHNARVDAVLVEFMPHLSRSQCATLVDEGCVSIVPSSSSSSSTSLLETKKHARQMVRKSERVEQGDILQVLYTQRDMPVEIKAQDIPLDILYEDEHMIVINKEAGMVVHPAVGNWDGTIVNALAYYLSYKSPFGPGEFLSNSQSINPHPMDGTVTTFRPGIVHRLDKGTSGVLVVAKTHQALATLSSSFARRQVQKTYLAVAIGNPGSAVIDKPIGRHPLNRQKMRVVPEPSQRVMRELDSPSFAGKKPLGRRAISHVQTLSFDSKLSVVEVRIETGR